MLARDPKHVHLIIPYIEGDQVSSIFWSFRSIDDMIMELKEAKKANPNWPDDKYSDNNRFCRLILPGGFGKIYYLSELLEGRI